MLKEWEVDYIINGVEPHRTTARNTSRHTYITTKLQMRLNQIRKLLKEVETFCFTHEVRSCPSKSLPNHQTHTPILYRCNTSNLLKKGWR